MARRTEGMAGFDGQDYAASPEPTPSSEVGLEYRESAAASSLGWLSSAVTRRELGVDRRPTSCARSTSREGSFAMSMICGMTHMSMRINCTGTRTTRRLPWELDGLDAVCVRR